MSWSPDGQLLAFLEVNPTTGRDIWVLRLAATARPQPFLQTPVQRSGATFFPDGRWLAYISDESGRYEIYVQPYPGPGEVANLDGRRHGAGVEPNGRELFYRNGDKMMAVDITTQPGFRCGHAPDALRGAVRAELLSRIANYDVSPDGQRFLMLKPSESAEAAPTQINVVLNWFEELKRRVPTGTK